MILVERELQNAYIGDYHAYTPSSSTIAYRPLNSSTTVKDMSGNGYNLTTSGSGISYDDLWVTLSNNSYFTRSPIIPPAWPFTINVWAMYLATSNGGAVIQQFNSSTDATAITISSSSGGNWFSRWKWSWDREVAAITTSKWTNVAYVYTSWTIKFYINGVVYSQSRTISTTSPNYLWVGSWWETYRRWYMNWKISELIIESSARTAQKVTDYYNESKWNYGL